MRAVLTCLLLGVCPFVPTPVRANPTDPFAEQLQGVWFGDGNHPLNQNVVIIQNNRLTVVSPVGVFTSTFTVVRGDAINQIDIDRYDGEQQLGLYKIDEFRLYLKLSRPNEPRPTIKDVTTASGKPHWHTVLKRQPTRRGLEVFERHAPLIVDATGQDAK